MQMDWHNDFTYYYFDGNEIKSGLLSSVPDEVEDYAKVHEAIGFVQHIGCTGKSQHVISSDYHRLCLEVLKIAVEKYGETFPVLLRGVRSNRPDSEHKILFGTTDRQVAGFYGEVREYRNIKGLRTNSAMKSVKTNNMSDMDEEVIFFA